MPRRRCIGWNRAAAGLPLMSVAFCGMRAAFAEIAIGEVPCDQDWIGMRLTGREMSFDQDGSAVAAGSCRRCWSRRWG